MGVYSYYYLGKWGDDGKLHHLAPFGKDGKPCCILSYKANWFNDQEIPMWDLPFEKAGQDIIDAFAYNLYEDGRQPQLAVSWCSLDDIDNIQLVKKGYVLKDEIKDFENEKIDDFGIVLDEHEYSKMLEDQLKGIKNVKKVYDCENDREIEAVATDFQYYMWTDLALSERAGFYLNEAAKIFAKNEDRQNIVIYRVLA